MFSVINKELNEFKVFENLNRIEKSVCIVNDLIFLVI